MRLVLARCRGLGLTKMSSDLARIVFWAGGDSCALVRYYPAQKHNGITEGELRVEIYGPYAEQNVFGRPCRDRILGDCRDFGLARTVKKGESAKRPTNAEAKRDIDLQQYFNSLATEEANTSISEEGDWAPTFVAKIGQLDRYPAPLHARHLARRPTRTDMESALGRGSTSGSSMVATEEWRGYRSELKADFIQGTLNALTFSYELGEHYFKEPVKPRCAAINRMNECLTDWYFILVFKENSQLSKDARTCRRTLYHLNNAQISPHSVCQIDPTLGRFPT